jgi:hypothetical protein
MWLGHCRPDGGMARRRAKPWATGRVDNGNLGWDSGMVDEDSTGGHVGGGFPRRAVGMHGVVQSVNDTAGHVITASIF